MPPALPVAVALLALLGASAVPAAAAGPRILVDPDPLVADAPFRVRLDGLAEPATVRNASLKVCLAERGVVIFCFFFVPMTRDGDAFVGESREAFGAGEEVGIAFSLVREDGREESLPPIDDDPSTAYYFHTVAAAKTRGVPALALPTALALLAAAAALLAHRPRGLA